VLQKVGFADLLELAVFAVFALSALLFFLAFDLSQVKKEAQG
jgi:hypothetical protein